MATVAWQFTPNSETQFLELDEASGASDQLPRRKAEREAREAIASDTSGTVPFEVHEVNTSAEIIPLPKFRAARNQEKVFSATKEWEGVVVNVTSSNIVANLRDLTASDEETDVVEIPLVDVPRNDRHLLREGAIFRYLIGYAKNYGGTLSTKRHVYIRRGKQKVSPSNSEAHWLELLEKLSG